MNRVRNRTETVLARNWGSLADHSFDFRRSDGTWQTLRREVYDHGHAAAVLLIDPKARMVTLVRQFRLPPGLSGDNPMVLEACAGLLDGDDPETCARKEAMEETGIVIETLIPAFSAYASPGSVTEKLHCFIGLYDGTAARAIGGGLHHEGEDIEVVEMDFDAVRQAMREGRIIDLKTVALLSHAALEGQMS
jgi:GDP-mannose pyrophosphatase NudK